MQSVVESQWANKSTWVDARSLWFASTMLWTSYKLPKGVKRRGAIWKILEQVCWMFVDAWRKMKETCFWEFSESNGVTVLCTLPWNEDWLLQSAVQLKLPIHSLYSLEYTSWIRAGCSAIYIYVFEHVPSVLLLSRTTFPPAHCLHTVFAKKFASFTPGLRCLLAVLPDGRAPP